MQTMAKERKSSNQSNNKLKNPRSDLGGKSSNRSANQWNDRSKRPESTLLSYWINQNLNSKIFLKLSAGKPWTQCGPIRFPQSSCVQTAYFTHWTVYAECGNTDFPQTVNGYSAEISENMEKFSKSSTI